MHIPVMLDRCVELLAPALPDQGAVLVDATLGLGGHAEAFLTRFPQLRVIGIDRDPAALAKCAVRLARFAGRVTLVRGVHEEIGSLMGEHCDGKANAILFDLGVSSMQLDQPNRGFSYSREAPLDMRMNPDDSLTAAALVNSYPPGDLVRILRQYGEEKSAKRIVEAIVTARQVAPIESTTQLAQLISDAIPAPARRTGGNPAKRTFQALRIEVNRELAGLPVALDAGIAALVLHGRIAVMSYHSLEDRIVKRRFAAGAAVTSPVRLAVIPHDARPQLRLLTRGAEVPSSQELFDNPRAASVRLRGAERVREAA